MSEFRDRPVELDRPAPGDSSAPRATPYDALVRREDVPDLADFELDDEPAPDPADRVPRGIPPEVWRRIQDGRRFNEERRPRYELNEVRLETGKIVDSYNPGREIVERKHTQLADIKEETAIGYLRDFARKYAPGETVSDTPRNRRQCPELVGTPLDGQMILEVPVQRRPVPRSVLEMSAELDIIIRDVEGKEYDL